VAPAALKNLTIVDIGEGIHYLQEDNPPGYQGGTGTLVSGPVNAPGALHKGLGSGSWCCQPRQVEGGRCSPLRASLDVPPAWAVTGCASRTELAAPSRWPGLGALRTLPA
jgi:hypothetical protein